MYIALKSNLTTNLITKTFLLNLKTLIYVSYNNLMLIIAHCYLHLMSVYFLNSIRDSYSYSLH